MKHQFLIMLLTFALSVSVLYAQVSQTSTAAHTFTIGDTDFLYDNQPIQIKCGEMHFARIPREYWRHRIQMAKAMGLNAVCAYLFWNKIEPMPDKFDWTHMGDAAEFCRIAQSEGMMVILRPGPYACAEWDLGGLPWWLLKKEGIKFRTKDDAYYMERCRKYLNEVGRVLAPLQITNGGPIIMVQVENEYASWAETVNAEYIYQLKSYLEDAGFNVPFFTCDGPGQIESKRVITPDIFNVVNFGGWPEWPFKVLRDTRSKGPLMAGEFYPGWFDTFTLNHNVSDAATVISKLKYMLDVNGSFSLYMAHGGTSFGMWAGAGFSMLTPVTSSYDYDAPIPEGGTVSSKYLALRNFLGGYLPKGEVLPAIPAANKVISIPPFQPTLVAPIIDNLGNGIKDCQIRNMEEYNYGYGCINYRTNLATGSAGILKITNVRDYATVYLDGQLIASLDGTRWQSECVIPARTKSSRLDIFVEATGRSNYGLGMYDTKKGITKKVEFIYGNSTALLSNWTVFPMPLDNDVAPKNLNYKIDDSSLQPAFYKASFVLSEVGDTYLDMEKWGKGLVWVNGHCLGRFWSVGPTQTMYLPGPWLKVGSNEIVIMDVQGPTDKTIQGRNTPILDKLGFDPLRSRLPGQGPLNFSGILPTDTCTFDNTASMKKRKFQKVIRGRYFCLNVLQNQKSGESVTNLSEINLQDATGKDISRSGWKIIYADSEELRVRDCNAKNAIDGNSTTYWSTQFDEGVPSLPHQLMIDLGVETDVAGFSVLPTSKEPNRCIKYCEVYVTTMPIPDLINPLKGLIPVATGTLTNDASLKTINFNTLNGRYLCVEALNSHVPDVFTTIAEINALNSFGQIIPRANWTVTYVDSEERIGEDGKATNVLDGLTNTFWHTEWKNVKPAHPHRIFIDMGDTYNLKGVTILPRQNNANGRIKDYKIYVSNSPFEGL